MAYNSEGVYDGFSSSQQGGGGNFASPSQNTMNQYGGGAGSGGKGAVKRDPQTLVPVSVKQVLEAQDVGGKFHIDGRLVSQVVVRGNVLSATVAETHASYAVEDGSGTITVKMYLDNDVEAPQVREQEYRTFVGKLVKSGGGVGMTAFAALPVEDSNMITVHLLDVILAHKRATGQPRQAGAAAAGMMQANGARPAAAAGGYGGVKGEQYGAQHAELPGFSHTGDPVRDAVLNAFATGPDATTDGGCSVSSVVEMLQRQHLSFEQVQQAIVALSNEGHLYSTIDEEHYKTTAQA